MPKIIIGILKKDLKFEVIKNLEGAVDGLPLIKLIIFYGKNLRLNHWLIQIFLEE